MASSYIRETLCCLQNHSSIHSNDTKYCICYCRVPFSRDANFAKRKFKDTIFTNLHFSSVCNLCHDKISNNFLVKQILWKSKKSTKSTKFVALEEKVPYAGPAEPVRLLRFWPDQFFLKVKTKFHFCKRQVINKVLVWFWDLLGLLY